MEKSIIVEQQAASKDQKDNTTKRHESGRISDQR